MRAPWVCSALLCWLALSATAAAQSDADAARNLFNAGVSAYKAGKFLAAGRAFMEARKQLKRPELLFSAAQAFRRQYLIDSKPAHLQLAVDHYRHYLDEVPTGGRRLDAANALAELVPELEKLGVSEAAAPTMSFGTGLMLTSPVADAVASFDGGPPQRLPLDLTVEPGPHRVVVQATGYRVAERRIVAVEGKLAAFDVPLDAEPAKLTIATITGAEVHIDGREIASTPLPRPLEVEPGVHLIEVRHRGYVPYAQELELGRGSTTALSLDQPMTHQRTAATVLLVGGGVGVAGGVAMMAAAALRQRRAVKIDEARQSRSISEQERRDYNRALRDRDALVRAGGVAASVGAGIGVTGLLLYFFDDPEAEPVELDGPNRAPGSPQEQPGFEMMLGPGGIGVEGRF